MPLVKSTICISQIKKQRIKVAMKKKNEKKAVRPTQLRGVTPGHTLYGCSSGE